METTSEEISQSAVTLPDSRSLSEQLNALQAIVDQSPDFMCVIDMQYRYVAFNQQYVRIMEQLYGAHIELGHHALEYDRPGVDLEAFKQDLARTLAGETIVSSRIVKEDEFIRHYYQLYYTPIKNSFGEVVGLVLTGKGIIESSEYADSLIDTDDLFKTSFIYAVVGKIVISPTWNFLRVNHTFCQMVGYSSRELYGMLVPGIVIPEDMPNIETYMRNAMNHALDSGHIECRLVCKNGDVIWVDVSGTVIRDSRGNMLYLLGDVQNFTQVKKVREDLIQQKKSLEDLVREQVEQLQESETRSHIYNMELLKAEQHRLLLQSQISALFENLPIPSAVYQLVYDDDGKVVDFIIVNINDIAAANFGKTAVELIGVKTSEILSGRMLRDDIEICENMRTGAVKHQQRETFLDNNQHHYLMSFFMLSEELMVIMGFDITEMKKVETDRLASEERFRLVFDNSMDAIFLGFPDGSIRSANPAATRMFGWSAEEFTRLERPEYIDYADSRLTDFLQTRNRTGYYNGELTGKHKDGHSFPIEISSKLFTDHQGVVWVSNMVRNITERKQAQVQLQATLKFNQTILETSSFGIVVYDPSGQCISANPAAGKFAGAPPEELQKQNLHNLESWKKAGLYDAALEAIKTGKPVFKQARMVTTFGKESYLNGTFSTFVTSQQSYLIAMFEDVSDRQETEDKLKLTNERLAALVKNLERSKQDAEHLREMSDLLQVCKHIDEAYAVYTQFAGVLFPGAASAVYIISDTTHMVENAAVWGDEMISENLFSIDDCWSLRRGQIHEYTAAKPGLLCRHMGRSFKGCYLDIPMIVSGEILGLLHIEWKCLEEPDQLTKDLALLTAENFALSLSNIRLRQRLQEQSIRDPLTGAFNRLYLEETLTLELPRAARKQKPVSVVMLDIDHFKKFNDTFGHPAGDQALIRLVGVLKGHVRGEDIVCRTGGEEFIMVLPETDKEVALRRAELLRTSVETMRIEYNSIHLDPITISLGVATFPQDGAGMPEILEKADQALYKAKRNGRNRCEKAG